MNFDIPIYLEQRQGMHLLRPLFFFQPVVRHASLARGTANLALLLRQIIETLDLQPSHVALSHWTFSPLREERLLELALPLKGGTLRLRLLIVIFHQQEGRRILFSPTLPDVNWLALEQGDNLMARLEEHLGRHFRKQQPRRVEAAEDLQHDEAPEPPNQNLGPTDRAWTTVISLEHTPRARHQFPPLGPPPQERASLGRGEPLEGDEELWQVGRNLDLDQADHSHPAFLREREVEELDRLLTGAIRRPVLLVGRAQVGKTAILREWVARSLAQRGGIHGERERVWLLAPGRLISGMLLMGQWQERVLAILEEARAKQHLLYFDDLLGLFLAGHHQGSQLNVATLLLPTLERGAVRIVGETTPEGLRVLREVHRGFADQFRLLSVEEPLPEANLRILIRCSQELEARHRCVFDPWAVPRAVELVRRYDRSRAFPGKAVALLERLAEQAGGRAGAEPSRVGEEQVLQAFCTRYGVSLALIDPARPLTEAQVREALGREVLGQPAAGQALAEVVSIARARLEDPSRPLASLLFLGPTGVGKAESARALARFLFGDESRLLRFDMNEYVEEDAAARLVWLLTRAVREQPSCVLLLDEIEKASPDVHQLLLQILEDGRLTDGLGRTTDFTGAIIILTSNLGVAEAGRQVGFGGPANTSRAEVYLKAAQQFFRPELFNRLDRIVPFAPLGRPELEQITARLIRELLAREGLVRRLCLVVTEPRAQARLVQQGAEPGGGGARELKRFVERELTRPLSRALARLHGERALRLELRLSEADALEVALTPLAEALPHPELPRDLALVARPRELVAWAEELLRGPVEDALAHHEPRGPVAPETLEGPQRFYFELKEQAIRAEAALELLQDAPGGVVAATRWSLGRGTRKTRLDEETVLAPPTVHQLSREVEDPPHPGGRAPSRPVLQIGLELAPGALLDELAARGTPDELLRLHQSPVSEPELRGRALLHQLRYLRVLLDAGAAQAQERVTLRCIAFDLPTRTGGWEPATAGPPEGHASRGARRPGQPPGGELDWATQYWETLRAVLDELGLRHRSSGPGTLRVEGPAAATLLGAEAGFHLIAASTHHGFLQVEVADTEQEPWPAGWSWSEPGGPRPGAPGLATPRAGTPGRTTPPPSIIRLYLRDSVIDLRSRLLLRTPQLRTPDLRTLLLAGLTSRGRRPADG